MRSQIVRRELILSAALGALLLQLRPAFADSRIVIPFSDTPGFDDTLSAAMRGGTTVIVIQIRPMSKSRLPPRLKPWIDRMLRGGGEVRWRDETPPSRGFWMVVIGAVLGALAEKVIDYLADELARPIERYNAVVVFVGGRNKDTYIKSIEFYRRDSSAWIDATANSKSIRP